MMQPNALVDFANRLLAHRQGDEGRVPQQGSVSLGPVRRHAVLPVGSSLFLARKNRGRSGQSVMLTLMVFMLVRYLQKDNS